MGCHECYRDFILNIDPSIRGRYVYKVETTWPRGLIIHFYHSENSYRSVEKAIFVSITVCLKNQFVSNDLTHGNKVKGITRVLLGYWEKSLHSY